MERIDWLFPIHRLILSTACHPFIDGLVLTEIVETSSFEPSFDDAGDVVPRPGAVPFVVVPMHGKVHFIVVPMHGKEENAEQADGMKRGPSYAIGQKRGPSYAS